MCQLTLTNLKTSPPPNGGPPLLKRRGIAVILQILLIGSPFKESCQL